MALFNSFPTCANRLQALFELDVLTNKAIVVPGKPTHGIQFATPSGTLYEADALTWKYYHHLASNAAYAINADGYGKDIGDKLFDSFFSSARRPISVFEMQEKIKELRIELGAE
jgi:hypothetical protein